MTESLWQTIQCVDHGGALHARVHEAGHAVIAAHLGVEFSHVEIYENPLDHPFGDVFLAGGMYFASPENRRRGTRSDPRKMFLMYLSGHLAEKLILGDALNDSMLGDFREWRIDMGLLDSTSIQELNAAIGGPASDAEIETRQLVALNQSAIRVVATRLEKAQGKSINYEEVCRIAKANTQN